MKLSQLTTIIENTIKNEVRKTIVEMGENKKEVYHIKCEGVPLATFETEKEAKDALPVYKKKHDGELIIEKGVYESHDDMIDKLDEMNDQLEETENMENIETHEGNAFAHAVLQAKEDGINEFEFDGKTYNVEECWKQLEEEESSEWKEEEECKECGEKSMDEKLVGNQHRIDKDKDGKITKKDFEMMRKETNEGKGMCSECGSMLNEEGMCMECGVMKESKKGKRVLRLKESEMIELIKKMVNESVPGLEITKKAQKGSKQDSETYAKEVGDKMKKASSFDGNDNPEFPKQIGKGEKMAIHNTEEENEYVEDNRGGTALNLDYDHEPSENFKKRLKASLEGDVKMGNSQDAANVVKSDLGKKLAKQAERKAKKEEEAPMYEKDPQPTKSVNESKVNFTNLLNEEIGKMKKLESYNKKTQ